MRAFIEVQVEQGRYVQPRDMFETVEEALAYLNRAYPRALSAGLHPRLNNPTFQEILARRPIALFRNVGGTWERIEEG